MKLSPRLAWGLTLGVSSAIVIADQVTKSWALSALGGGKTRSVFWTLRFNLHFNSGMAFSRGRGMGPVIGVFAIAIVVGLLATMKRRDTALATGAVGLVVGGALGNLIDRAFRAGSGFLGGRVVDFIDLQWWPVFNIADAGIVVGALLLILVSSRGPAKLAST